MIPVEKAPLIIPIANLHNLPTGARFMAKEGRATAEVEVKGDTLYVTATCDSLQQLVLQYEKELTYLRDKTEDVKEQSKSAFPFKWFLIGVLTGFILTIIGLIFKK